MTEHDFLQAKRLVTQISILEKRSDQLKRIKSTLHLLYAIQDGLEFSDEEISEFVQNKLALTTVELETAKLEFEAM